MERIFYPLAWCGGTDDKGGILTGFMISVLKMRIDCIWWNTALWTGINFVKVFLWGCTGISCHRWWQFAWCGCKPGEIFFSGRESGYENAVSNGYGRAFKIYVSDLGLFCAKKDLMANDILYMVEELNDFVIQRNGKLIPIEVKSADNTRAKSLKILKKILQVPFLGQLML